MARDDAFLDYDVVHCSANDNPINQSRFELGQCVREYVCVRVTSVPLADEFYAVTAFFEKPKEWTHHMDANMNVRKVAIFSTQTG